MTKVSSTVLDEISGKLGKGVIPILLIIIGVALSIVGPLAGFLMIIFLPLIIAGIIIGYREGKKNKD